MTSFTEKEQWLARCKARYVALAGLDDLAASQSADACMLSQEEVNGRSIVAWDSPESAAEEDLACWEDDGAEP